MKSLFLTLLLCLPAAAASPDKAEQEWLTWLGSRIETLRLSDDAVKIVWGTGLKTPGQMIALAQIIAESPRMLNRYTSSLKQTLRRYGHVNPLDQKLSERVWRHLGFVQDDIAEFEATAGRLGLRRPEKGDSLRDALEAPAQHRPGDKRYNPDSGDYETLGSDGNWK